MACLQPNFVLNADPEQSDLGEPNVSYSPPSPERESKWPSTATAAAALLGLEVLIGIGALVLRRKARPRWANPWYHDMSLTPDDVEAMEAFASGPVTSRYAPLPAEKLDDASLLDRR